LSYFVAPQFLGSDPHQRNPNAKRAVGLNRKRGMDMASKIEGFLPAVRQRNIQSMRAQRSCHMR
jgi:hypothetical protein